VLYRAEEVEHMLPQRRSAVARRNAETRIFAEAGGLVPGAG